jgi:hypothetical protein
MPVRHERGERMALKVVTRERIHVDRVACPWLIRRFIDPDAGLLFVPREEVLAVAEREGALPYDTNAEIKLTHRGEECSFDAFIHRYHLEGDVALMELTRIVRCRH